MDSKYLLAADSVCMHGVQPEHKMWLKVLLESAAVGKQLSWVSEQSAARVLNEVYMCGARLPYL